MVYYWSCYRTLTWLITSLIHLCIKCQELLESFWKRKSIMFKHNNKSFNKKIYLKADRKLIDIAEYFKLIPPSYVLSIIDKSFLCSYIMVR